MHANHREDLQQIGAGAIAAAVGLKQTTTGDTLCDPDKPVVLESIDFPDPVIDVAVEPKTKADQDKLAQALQRLAEEDPTFRVRTNEETGQTIIAGMGELHLEIIVDRLMREFRVDANVGRPQVAYRETIRNAVQGVHGRFVRQTGGRGQYGHVVIDMAPNEPGVGYDFENKIVGGAVPREYISSVDAGIKEAMEAGMLAGFPVVDVGVTARRRLLPRRRLLGDGVQGGRLDGLQGGRRSAPSRCCSSPSWPSRWSRPRTTWATSSATSTRAAGRSRAWSRAATRRSSAPACRSPRCSVTPPMCAR